MQRGHHWGCKGDITDYQSVMSPLPSCPHYPLGTLQNDNATTHTTHQKVDSGTSVAEHLSVSSTNSNSNTTATSQHYLTEEQQGDTSDSGINVSVVTTQT